MMTVHNHDSDSSDKSKPLPEPELVYESDDFSELVVGGNTDDTEGLVSTPIDDEEDARYPKSNRILTSIILSVMGAGAYVADIVMTKLDVTLIAPYKYVLSFYNATLLVPAQTFPKVWDWLVALELTKNPDIDRGISIVGIILYWAILLELYSIWVEGVGIIMARLGNYDRPDIMGAFKVYFLPALIFLLFYLLVNIFLLYGDTSTFDIG